jgi:outer membrane protein TolC
MVDLGSDTATLDRLIQLAEEDLRAAEGRHQAGVASTGELQDTQLKLAEAKLRRVEQRGDKDLRERLLEEVVGIRRQQLDVVKTQQERGTVPATAVREAEAALLEAQSRLEAVNSGGSPDADKPGD